ncbi:MAG TPA: class IV adenylate cyclase [Candidatus Polarisedimenticolia bacterium]|nr:class IV adenylate cyclase [Candidatus Polarisedimenticolia bacterium]
MATLEIEVKLRAADVADARARLERFGARLLHPREFEDNRLYDFPDKSLMNRGAMLRLRVTDRGAFLTYKDRARTEDGVKVREEIESAVPGSEAARLAETLERLGMTVAFRYQKFRTTWASEGLHLTLDETPIGIFIELEGERPAIDHAAVTLGFSTTDYIASSYRDLYLTAPLEFRGRSDRMLFPDDRLAAEKN